MEIEINGTPPTLREIVSARNTLQNRIKKEKLATIVVTILLFAICAALLFTGVISVKEGRNYGIGLTLFGCVFLVSSFAFPIFASDKRSEPMDQIDELETLVGMPHISSIVEFDELARSNDITQQYVQKLQAMKRVPVLLELHAMQRWNKEVIEN
jgi:drug/metabolite transporter superfamily protein YnfA